MSISRPVRVFAIAALMMSAGMAALHLAQDFPLNSIEALVLMSFATQIVLVLAAIGGASIAPTPLAERLGLHPGRLRWRSLLLLCVGMLALSHALDGALQITGLREGSALAELGEQVSNARGRALVLTVLGLAIVPGFAEELLCRGFLQRGMSERFSPPLAIGVAALVFGALHIEPVHATVATVLGLYLGVTAHWSGSTRAAIGLHVVNNLTSVVLMVGPSHSGATLGVPLVLTVPAAFLLCAGCLWRVRGDVTRIRAASRAQEPRESSMNDLEHSDTGAFRS